MATRLPTNTVTVCRAAKAVALPALLLLHLVSTVQAEDSSEREGKIKAACLYHLIQYITWPNLPTATPGSTKQFTVCHIGQDPAIPFISETLGERTKVNLPFTTKQLDNSKQKTSSCNLILLGEAEAKLTNQVVSSSSFTNSLSVGSGNCDKRYDVCLEKKSNRLAIRLRQANLQKRGFKISSELLQIAEIE